MTLPDEAITDRPWRGKCATTGLTMDDFRERLASTNLPPAVTRAAVSIVRSYGSGIRGWSDPGYVANVIGGEMARAGIIPCDKSSGGHQHGPGCSTERN